MPDTGVPVWLVQNAAFDRPGGPYVDAEGLGWRDNHLRFALLSRVAALITIAGGFLGWRPDVVHANDWQCGLVPVYLRRWNGPITPSVFTIHNLQYQGNFDPWILSSVAVSPSLFNLSGVEFYGRVSFMKAALQFSRKITAVSPTYAREIQTPELGMGFHRPARGPRRRHPRHPERCRLPDLEPRPRTSRSPPATRPRRWRASRAARPPCSRSSGSTSMLRRRWSAWSPG